jgi:IS30 family transposase
MKQGRKPALNPEDVERIRFLYRTTNMSMERIGRRYNVSQGTIDRAIMRRPPYNYQRLPDAASHT